jgi:acyl carrier protein
MTMPQALLAGACREAGHALRINGLVECPFVRQTLSMQPSSDVIREVLGVLDEALSLGGRSATFTPATHLLGAVPEFDSMAVVAIITSLEERLGIMIDDDDIDGQTFATVGSLCDFVAGKLAA